MTSDNTLFPPLLWAQRLDYILITVFLQDCQNVKLQLPDDGNTFFFSCDTPPTGAGESGKHYRCSLPLYHPVSAEESHHVVRPRQVEIKLKKLALKADANPEEDETSWPRLTKMPMKNKNIKIDWNRWREDDMEDDPNDGFGIGEGDELDLQALRMNARKEAAEAVGFDESQIPPFGSMKDAAAAGKDDALDYDDDMPPLEEDTL
ncbi:unnamed protein product [Phytomonas sp. Hart1]|eukprot:CCW67641.1 unnamed protein product [Phytomonas sp. isolate Hart1]